MLATCQSQLVHGEDPFVSYARSLHDYTLQLWTESIRVTQEKKAASKADKRTSGQKYRDQMAKEQGILGF